MGSLTMESLRAIVDDGTATTLQQSRVIYLSTEAEWVLRRCHENVARRSDKKALVSQAADEARRYELWEYEKMPQIDILMARLRLLARITNKMYTTKEAFVELVRCPPSQQTEIEDIESDRSLLALEADSSIRLSNWSSWQHYRKELDRSLHDLGNDLATIPPPLQQSQSRSTTIHSRYLKSNSTDFILRERADYLQKREAYIDQRLDTLRASNAAFDAAQALDQTDPYNAYAMARKCLEPLDQNELNRVNHALRQPSTALVISTSNADILGEHTARLSPGKWLVDELINFYFELLQERDKLLTDKFAPNWISSHFFSSFFIPALLGENARTYQYARVRRWTKRFDIFQKRFVFIPVNVGNMHWTLLRFDIPNKEIRYFDSMGSNGAHYLRAGLKYLQDEHMNKKSQPLPDADAWTLTPTTDNTPRQLNGYDCGVFATFCAHFNSLDGTEPDFAQNEIPHLRKRMMLCLLDKSIPF